MIKTNEWEKIKPAPQPADHEEWQLKLGGTTDSVSLKKTDETEPRKNWLACVCIVDAIYMGGIDPPLGSAMLWAAKLLERYAAELREGAWGVAGR